MCKWQKNLALTRFIRMLRGGGYSARIPYIDSLKGFGILCVVLGHIARGYYNAGLYPEASDFLKEINNFVYAFHMPLMMMISGYVYHTAYFTDDGVADRRRVNCQIYNHVATYIIFSIPFGLCQFVFSSVVNRNASLLDIGLILVKPISPYWYLYVLVIFYFFFSATRILEINKWVLLTIFSTLSVCGQIVNISWFSLSLLLYCISFFYIGILYSEYKNWMLVNQTLIYIMFCIAIIIYVFLLRRGEGLLDVTGGIVVFSIISAMGISLAIWFAFKHIGFLAENKFLQFCGKYCLEIYVIHCFFTAGMRAMLSRFGVHNVYISVCINMIISTLIPVIFSLICKKLYIWDLFFKPMTYVKNKKEQVY